MFVCPSCGDQWTTEEGALRCCVCPWCKERPRRRRHAFCSTACLMDAFNAESKRFRERDRAL